MKLSAYLLLIFHVAFAIAASATQPDQNAVIAAEPPCCPAPENSSTSVKPSEANGKPTTTDNETPAQIMYRINLLHALIATPLLTTWSHLPIKYIEQALASKKPFDDNASKILTNHARTLLRAYP